MNHLKTGNSYFGAGSYVKYKFGGKELQETGMYSYGWREYMPDIGGWNAIDQLAESYLPASPYAYVLNNPVNMFDPYGRVSQEWFSGFLNSTDKSSYWTNTGSSFISDSHIEIGYNGSYISLNSNYADGGIGDKIVEIPGVTINVHGNESTWNNASNFGYNSNLIMSKITGALGDWNYDQNSSNMGQYILNSKASREVAEFEKFLFIEMPLSFAGGELLSVGWRAAGLSKYICGPVGRLTNGLIKICFTEGTLVATEDGNRKIEDIKEGDQVWSYNEATGRKELKKVVALSRNTSSSLVKITVNGTEITCTPEHPFYTNGTWTAAKDLTPGMLLATLDEKTSPIISVSILEEKVKVYNFEVEGNHNYYVSEEGILVHNNCERFLGLTDDLYAEGQYYMYSKNYLSGNTYVKSISTLMKATESTDLKLLLRTMINEGKSSGASMLELRGTDIMNNKLFNEAVAKRLGFTFEKLSDSSIRLTAPIP